MKPIKTVGIMTFHRAHNYGAVWQCWALKHACESIGCSVQTIDYNPFGRYTIMDAIRHSPWVAYMHLMFMYQFDRFVKSYLNPSNRTESHDEIIKNLPLCDAYIVGSDQVWAKAIVGEYLNSYLLDFAPENTKRITYAASTGGNSMDLTDYQLNEIRKFSAISIREKQAVANVQEKVKVQVADVCDPAMLLKAEDYEAVERKPCCLPKHYIAYFNLVGDTYCEETAKNMGQKLGLPIVNLVGKYKSWAKRNYIAPTPEQWLYILHHADYVVTNSFHGTVFSIVFHRPFICCGAKSGSRIQTNGRILNLLEQTHLQDRYITDAQQIQEIGLMGENMDNEKYVSEYRERSLEWLKNAIEL